MKRTALALAAAFVTISAQAQISGDVVKIGFITDLSGVYSDVDGNGGAEAIRMAIADVKGAVNGKKIQLVVADHQNKPDIAASKAREWFDQQGVDLLIGGTNSGASLAMAKVAAEKKKLFIAIGSGTPRIRIRGSASMTVTRAPRRRALAASSSPMKPAPTMMTWPFSWRWSRMASASAWLRSVTILGPTASSRRGAAPVARSSLS